VYGFWILFLIATSFLVLTDSGDYPNSASLTFRWVSIAFCGIAVIQFIFGLARWRKTHKSVAALSTLGLIAATLFLIWSSMINGTHVDLGEVYLAWFIFIPIMLAISVIVVRRRFSNS